YFSSLTMPPPGPTLFPYTTLFRSRAEHGDCPDVDAGEVRIHAERRAAVVRRRHRLVEDTGAGLDRCLLAAERVPRQADSRREVEDRKSTRLNSSHDQISYAVFCLK